MVDQLSKTATQVPFVIEDEPTLAPREQPLLVVMHGPLLGMTYCIGDQPLTIGRQSNSDIPIDDDNVSRRHAEIFVKEDQIWIRDLDSTNGTLVNSQRATEVPLRDGDLILIGRVLFKLIKSTTVENQFFGQMYALATTDFLTGAFNRQHILSLLEREFGRSRRYQRSLSIVGYDVDHLKKVNDAFGELAGDQLLIESSRLVKSLVRQQDWFGRIGGDEFLIVCPETDLASAIPLAQRLSQTVSSWSYVHQSRRLDFSISIGIAVVKDEIRRPEDLLQRAEDSILRSKHRGRNQVSF